MEESIWSFRTYTITSFIFFLLYGPPGSNYRGALLLRASTKRIRKSVPSLNQYLDISSWRDSQNLLFGSRDG